MPNVRDIGHTLVVGPTRFGKTTIVKKHVTRLMQRHGIPVLALSSNPAEWDEVASYATDDPDAFVRTAFEHVRCNVVIDEGAELAGRYDRQVYRLATRGRHNGHLCYFLAQDFMSFNKLIRKNCSSLILFKQPKPYLQELHNQFMVDEILTACDFEKGECLWIVEYGSPRHIKNVWEY